MIEIIENAIQIVVTFLCAGYAFGRAIVTRTRTWLLLGLFYSVYFLGDLYWQLFLWYYRDVPQYTFIPYLSWYGSYLFLFILLAAAYSFDWKKNARYLWPAPLFTAAMCAYYMTFGDYFSNIIAAVLMAALLWRSIGGLIAMKGRSGDEASARFLYISVLLFCLITYASWTSTCFWYGDTWTNPYLWFDICLTIIMVMLIPAERKAFGR